MFRLPRPVRGATMPSSWSTPHLRSRLRRARHALPARPAAPSTTRSGGSSVSRGPRRRTAWQRGVRIPVRDGVELAADLYRAEPEAAGTLLTRGPYGRSLPMALPFARVFAERGYNVLNVSCRGTFGSGGTFDPMVSEVDDGHDVVAWMRGQPWFTGTFGTLGPSYLGFTQWALLVDPPPELSAAVISVAPHDFSRHVWGTGAFRLDFLGWSHMVAHQEDGGVLRGALRMATAERRNAGAMDELPLTRAASTYLGGRAPWYTDWVTRSDLSDPFWEPMNVTRALDRVDVPVLLLSGWHDLFLEQTLEQYAHLRGRGVEVAMTVGPWSHVAVGAGAARINSSETLEWFEEHIARRGLAPSRRAGQSVRDRRRRVAGPSGLAAGHPRPDVVPRTARRPPRRSTSRRRARLVLPLRPVPPDADRRRAAPQPEGPGRRLQPGGPARLPHPGVRAAPDRRRSRGRAGRRRCPTPATTPTPTSSCGSRTWALTAAPITSPRASRGWIRTGGRVRFPCASGPRPTGSSPGTASAW